MLRLLIDENVDHRILRGLKSRLLQLNYLLVGQIGMSGFSDLELLSWAAQEGRVIVTHDRKTMIPYAEHCVRRGEPMAGVIFIPRKMKIGRAISDLEIIVECLSQNDLRGRIERLPL